jgi:transposase-like protein
MFTSLIDFNDFFKTEKKAISYFIKMRWNGKVECPFENCDSKHFTSAKKKIYTLKSGKDFKCACCGKIFSYKTGTIFENSKLSMKKWFLAIYLMTSHKKGISSPQLGKFLKIRQATAWFVLQRLRHVGKNFFNQNFDGITEIDECYVGGSEANRHSADKKRTGAKEKTVILGMVERETGQVKAIKVESAKTYDLQDAIYETVKEGSDIVTDSYAGYDCLGWNYKHSSVNHSAGEYVKTDAKTSYKIHTNTIEGYWSLVKRTINGTHHWISKKHTQSYLSEMEFRYNTRADLDTFRFTNFVNKVSGLRLKYKELIA